MENNGIDILIECPLEPEILSIEPENFIEEILVKRLGIKRIFCGEDCGFGYKRRGNAQLLKDLENKYENNDSTMVGMLDSYEMGFSRGIAIKLTDLTQWKKN